MAASHNGSNWVKPAKNKSTKVFSGIFSSKFQQSHYVRFQSLLYRFILENCQTVVGISIHKSFGSIFWREFLHSIIRHFHEIFETNFWQEFDFRSNCVARANVAACLTQ